MDTVKKERITLTVPVREWKSGELFNNKISYRERISRVEETAIIRESIKTYYIKDDKRTDGTGYDFPGVLSVNPLGARQSFILSVLLMCTNVNISSITLDVLDSLCSQGLEKWLSDHINNYLEVYNDFCKFIGICDSPKKEVKNLLSLVILKLNDFMNIDLSQDSVDEAIEQVNTSEKDIKKMKEILGTLGIKKENKSEN